MRKVFLAIATLHALTNCSFKGKDANTPYHKEIKEWQQQRSNSLKAPYGWKSLIGLHWFSKSKDSFLLGSSKDADISLPQKMPEKVGLFTLYKNTWTFTPLTNDIKYNGTKITNKTQITFEEKDDFFQHKSLRFYLIKRSKGFGLRIKDSKSKALTDFKELSWHPISTSFKIKAKFIANKPVKFITIPDILGGKSDEESPGKLVFKIKEKEFNLATFNSGENLFIIFRDQSSNKGGQSYPSGRFLIVDGPIAEEMVLDFNKAYNPPCAYTPWATCPLPPIENMITASIPAGEAYLNEDH